MKMKFAYICLLAVVLGSCSKKNDRAFDTTPEERINALVNQYQTQLAGGVNGWKALLTNPQGNVYGFYFKFNDKNRVVSYSDFKSDFAQAKESSYRLKALQQVSLLFDTYTYLHVLADPDPSVAGGTIGEGYSVDFEFYFDNATADTINLVGRKNNSRMQLVRATKAEEDALTAGGMKKAMALNDNYGKILQYWKTFTLGSITYQLSLDTAGRTATIFYKYGASTRRSSTKYYYNGTGLVFVDPVVTPVGITINGFTDITWNATTQSFSMKVGNTTVSMAGANQPAAIEGGIAQNFRVTAAQADSYWYNTGGIRVNGVNNAYRLDTLTFHDSTGTYINYYNFYQPGTLSATTDAFAPIFLNQAQTGVYLKYGSHCNVAINNTDGRMVLTENKPLDGYTYPASGGADLWRKWMYNAGGVYLVKITDDTYDMVSGSDATSWMRWYLW